MGPDDHAGREPCKNQCSVFIGLMLDPVPTEEAAVLSDAFHKAKAQHRRHGVRTLQKKGALIFYYPDQLQL